jgi:hypothetical protein
MNNFCRLLKNIDILFGQIVKKKFMTKIWYGGLVHDHGLLWVKNVPQFNILSNQ